MWVIKHIKMTTECGGGGKENDQSKAVLIQTDLRQIFSKRNMDFLEQRHYN